MLFRRNALFLVQKLERNSSPHVLKNDKSWIYVYDELLQLCFIKEGSQVLSSAGSISCDEYLGKGPCLMCWCY